MRFSNSLAFTQAISESARDFENFRYPATVDLLLSLYAESHVLAP